MIHLDDASSLADRRALRRTIMAAAAKRAPRKLPRPMEPTSIVLDYLRLMRRINEAMNTAVMSHLAAEGLVHNDAADGAAPAIPILDLVDRKRMLARLRRRLGSIASQKNILAGLDALAARTETFSREQWKRQLNATIGVDLTADPDLSMLVSRFRRENTARITALAGEKVDRVRVVLTEAGPGTRVEDITSRIVEQTGASDSHAALIARTEVTSLNARMTQARHESAGITQFKVSTSHDQRVRESHKLLDGRVFSYAALPIVDDEPWLPGATFNCRCIALPVIEGFEGA